MFRSPSAYYNTITAGRELWQNPATLVSEPQKTEDDLATIQRRQNRWAIYRVSELSRLKYLNLFDYENKTGDCRLGVYGVVPMSVNQIPNNAERSMEYFEHYVRCNIFHLYLKYLRNHLEESVDLQTFSERVSSAAICLRHCEGYILHVMAKEAINLYLDCDFKRLLPLPIFLRNICVSREMIPATARYLFNACSVKFIKEFLDASIKTQFNLWNMWKRNSNVGDVPFCPVTYACFTEMFGILRLLLDYGFQIFHQRTETLKAVLDELLYFHEVQWFDGLLFKDGQSSRCSVVDEVFYFVNLLHEDYSEPECLIRCFNLTWDARKDPFVSRQELLDCFETHIRDGFLSPETGEPRVGFMKSLDVFQSMVPDYKWEELQPRSLQHLCRCTIREALNDNWQMPRGVSTLPIPDKMKSYILLNAE